MKTKRNCDYIHFTGKIAPWSKPNIVLKPSYRLSVISKLKSPVKTLNKCNIVNKINCLDCNDFYIGMTRRRLHKRLHKHKSRQYCAVFKHIFVRMATISTLINPLFCVQIAAKLDYL